MVPTEIDRAVRLNSTIILDHQPRLSYSTDKYKYICPGKLDHLTFSPGVVDEISLNSHF
jgi:hypothetical protein